TEDLENLKLNTIRLLLRAYRVERLRRLAVDPLGPVIEQPRVELTINARSDSDATAKCALGAGRPITTVDGRSRAQQCSLVVAEITNVGSSPRYVHVFSIDPDWNIVQRCTDGGDTGGTGAVLFISAIRKCVFKHDRASGDNDPSIPDVAQ